jgi:hypothetical protein
MQEETPSLAPEAQNLVDAVTTALRDVRSRGKKQKVLTALSFMAPEGLDAMVWSKTVLAILDGNGATASILNNVVESCTVRSLKSALQVLRRLQD